MPADDVLVVEGRRAVDLVDKVHPGLPVELIFSAFVPPPHRASAAQ